MTQRYTVQLSLYTSRMWRNRKMKKRFFECVTNYKRKKSALSSRFSPHEWVHVHAENKKSNPGLLNNSALLKTFHALQIIRLFSFHLRFISWEKCSFVNVAFNSFAYKCSQRWAYPRFMVRKSYDRRSQSRHWFFPFILGAINWAENNVARAYSKRCLSLDQSNWFRRNYVTFHKL